MPATSCQLTTRARSDRPGSQSRWALRIWSADRLRDDFADPYLSWAGWSGYGAGRMLGRKRAIRELDQASIDTSFDEMDILTNCRKYPRDEAPAAYKDFEEVLRSVKLAGLATEVARLKARFLIKDGDEADD